MCDVVQVSGHGVLVMELSGGLSFPATEYLSHVIHTEALQGTGLFVRRSLCRRHLLYMNSDLCFAPFLVVFPYHLLTRLLLLMSPSDSSTVGGAGLPSRQCHRLHTD